MVIESSLPESLISALDIRSSSNIQDAASQTANTIQPPVRRQAECDDRYIITLRADPTAWFRLYRLERFPELKRKYRFSLIGPLETDFGSNPTVALGWMGRKGSFGWWLEVEWVDWVAGVH